MRLIVPDWPGSLSQKWLTRVTLLAQPHRGQGMGGTSYRLPVRLIVPGGSDDGASFADMESMPVRSVLTNVAHGTRLPAGTRRLDIREHASADFGRTWPAMEVASPVNPHAWQRWTRSVELPSDGCFEMWYRATDDAGRMQPHQPANWSPQGYGANAISRVAVLVG